MGTSFDTRRRLAAMYHINALVKEFRSDGQPAISVDTKKKENVGDFKNAGRTLRPKGEPEPVQVHGPQGPQHQV
jgi:hypothetical protein